MLRKRKRQLAQQLLQQEGTSRILDAIELPPSDHDSYYSREQQQQQQEVDDDDDFQVEGSIVAASSRHSVVSRSNLPVASRQSASLARHSIAASVRQSPAPTLNRSITAVSVERNSVESELGFSLHRSQPLEEEDDDDENDPFSDGEQSDDDRSAANTRSVVSGAPARRRKNMRKEAPTLAPMDDAMRAEVYKILKKAVSQAMDDIVKELGLPKSAEHVSVHSALTRMMDVLQKRIYRTPIPSDVKAKMFNREKMEASNAKIEATIKSMLSQLITVERGAREDEIKLEEEKKQFERLQELERTEQERTNKKREELMGIDKLLAQGPPEDDYVLSLLHYPSSKFS